jgi:ABC-type lipoprotein release transport system permease subunit
MRFGNHIFIMLRELRRNKGRTLSLVISLIIASFFLLLALGLWQGVRAGIIPKLEEAFPEKTLLVKPRQAAIGNMRLDTAKLTRETLDEIRSFSGVEFVSPQLTVAFPCRAISDIFGSTFSTDVVVIGVEERIIARYLPAGENFRYHKGEPIPTLISNYFINLFNLGLSDSLGMPKFDSNAILGKTFVLVLGESTLGETFTQKKVRAVECALTGLTPDLSLIGMVIPLEAVEEFNQWFWEDKLEEKYSLLRVGVEDVNQIESVAKRIENLDLTVESNVEELNRLRMNLKVVLILIFLFVASVTFLAGMNIINITLSVYRENIRDVVLLRLLGLPPRQLAIQIALHRAFIGFIGGMIGAYAAYGISIIVNRAVVETFRNLPFVPENLIMIPILWIFVLTGFTLLVNILIALMVHLPCFRNVPSTLMKETQP